MAHSEIEHERYAGLTVIDNHYAVSDETKRLSGVVPYHDTAHGIWGASNLRKMYELFRELKLDAMRGLCDLGSGDGRIVLVASLFTQSCGIEGDKVLCEVSQQSRNALLLHVPVLARCSFIYGDYTLEDLSLYDVLFIFADHAWNDDFEQSLIKSWNGVVLSYGNIFAPKRLKKGRTYWAGQTPVVSYPVGTFHAVGGFSSER